jgi:cytochrome c oxidase subunit 3
MAPVDNLSHIDAVAHQFDDRAQQKDAGLLGMWVFLATEVLFFGGLFTAYLLLRFKWPAAFAVASEQMDIVLGAVNTGVLLTSSLTMALGVRAAQLGHRKGTVALVLITMCLGLVFLGIKAFEYHHKFVEGLFPGEGFRFEGTSGKQVEAFFVLYFMMTGLHALHMVIGIGLMGTIAGMAWRGKFSPTYYTPVEISGLYWHFVDIIWIFLFPLLYLIHPHL